MSLKAIAQMVQTLLYGKRFFPYYTFVILAGIEGILGKILLFTPIIIIIYMLIKKKKKRKRSSKKYNNVYNIIF